LSIFEIILLIVISIFIIGIISTIVEFISKYITPREIRKGEVFLSEDYIQTDIPVKLNGKPDFVYKNRNNLLTVVEVKNRANPIIYESDIIQMSTYATILKNSNDFTDYRVNPNGIMCFINNGNQTYKKVSLLSDRKIIKLHNRYLNIMKGSNIAKKAPHKGLCKYCGFKKEC